MMTDQDSAQVVSGVPYLVTAVAGRPPVSLHDFVGSVQFTVTRQAQLCHIGGLGAEGDLGVRFNQKAGTTGKDLRVWEITQDQPDGPFHAQTASNF